MNKRDIMDIMASDMKLWDTAETKEDGKGSVQKTLDLPFGIGTYTVTLEGLKDAGKRRDAVQSYGAHIRGLIKERIDDEAITARAKAAAARNEQAGGSGSLSGSPEGVPNPGTSSPAVQGASETYQEATADDADFGTTLAARRAEVSERIKRVEADLTRWRRELRGLDAALKAMEEDDAPKNSTETGSS